MARSALNSARTSRGFFPQQRPASSAPGRGTQVRIVGQIQGQMQPGKGGANFPGSCAICGENHETKNHPMQQMNAGKSSVPSQITPKRKAMPKRRMQPGVRRATQGYAQDSGYFVFTASPENDEGPEFSSFCGMILVQGNPIGPL